jgi:hypothetical protein
VPSTIDKWASKCIRENTARDLQATEAPAKWRLVRKSGIWVIDPIYSCFFFNGLRQHPIAQGIADSRFFLLPFVLVLRKTRLPWSCADILRKLHRSLPSEPSEGWFGTLPPTNPSALRYDTTLQGKAGGVFSLAAPGQTPCLRSLHFPMQQRMPTSLPFNPTTRITPIPTSLAISIEVPTPTPPAQIHTIPMRSPSLLANLRRRQRSPRMQLRRMSARSSSTIAMGRGTITSNTKLRGSNRQPLRR